MPRPYRYIAAVLLAACTSTQPGTATDAAAVTLTLTPVAPSPGDSVTLILTNDSDSTAGYNLCASSLFRRTGGEWVHVPEDRFCTLELRLLPPNQRAEFTLRLPATLESGTYRYQTSVDWADRGEVETVSTPQFDIPG